MEIGNLLNRAYNAKTSFFADTANPDEISYCFSSGIRHGITTNPKIMETTGDLTLGFKGACKKILSQYRDVPVSIETDLRGMDISQLEYKAEEVRDVLLEQAYDILSWASNTVIKIPISRGGLLATKELAKRGAKTNVTACMTRYQALSAAITGATYVSLFANRMLDARRLELAGYDKNIINEGGEWKGILRQLGNEGLQQAWSDVLYKISDTARALDGTNTSLIVGSIRSHQDILMLMSARPQVITIPTKIVMQLEQVALDEPTFFRMASEMDEQYHLAISCHSLAHPMTTHTLKEFEDAAKAYRRVKTE